MNHVAVDLGSKQSQLCVRGADGVIQREARVKNADLGKALELFGPSRVVMESCSEAFAVADLAITAQHQVNIVPAGLARSLGVGQRGVKTDKKDARNLSLASCRMETLPEVHIPSVSARELRALLTSRSELVWTRTALTNNVRGWMRTQLLNSPRGTRTDNFPERIREAALNRPHGLPIHIDRILKVVELLTEQIKEADQDLEQLASRDEVCQRLMTVPGVGPVTSTTFRSTVDEVGRFSTSHAIASYLGLAPGENSSGEKTQRTGITKAGSTRVRTALMQAAWSAWRTRPNDPMVQWAKKLAQRRPKQVAIVALARKMSGILFAIWRDASEYDPANGAGTTSPSA
jgi:transposase